jgi:type IV pilus assembly protein PilC
MPIYTYVAKNTISGEKSKGEIESENERAAARLLFQKSLIPLELKESSSGAKFKVNRFRNRIKTKQKVIFSRQLSTLLNAGLPLLQSLTTVYNQTSSVPFKNVIAKIINDVQAGGRLSDSMAKHPDVFDNIFISLIASGEESGTLSKSLDRIALQQEKDSETLSKVRGAMIYPLIVMVVLGGVMIFMLTTLLPQVEGLYKSLPGADLPFITKLLLGLSKAILEFWWIFILLIVGMVLFVRNWIKTKSGRAALDGLKMHSPMLGAIFMKLYMARFARTGATLASSGVPMIKMLSTTADGIGNVHVANSIRRSIEEVKGGKALSETLKGDPNFLDLVPDMIHIGEQSGELDAMLEKVADYYEKEVETQIKSINTIIEPALMVVVGIFALIIVAAVLLPIYGLAGKNIGGG